MSSEEDHNDDAALAAEYVLHLLDEDARAAFEARMAVEPDLRDLVRAWDESLVTLSDEIAPVAPPANVKARLSQSLFPETSKRSRPLWMWLTGGLVAAGLAVGAVLLVPSLPPFTAFEPTLTARIAAEDGALLVSAQFIEETNTLELVRETGAARPGRVLELWLIAEGADAPVSLGVLPEAVETQIDVTPVLAAQLADGLLAISDEPQGGSPTGAPTGDVLAAGPITSI